MDDEQAELYKIILKNFLVLQSGKQEKALEPLVTGKEDRGGYGLTSIKDYVLENNDILGIRSGRGFLYIQNGIIKKGRCCNLKGTQLYLRLSAL